MICVDTTFLVDLWRSKGALDHPCVKILREHEGEVFLVPAHAAGEFLEGGARVSAARARDSLAFLRMFRIGTVGLETARHYASIVSHLRERSLLRGASKPDVWIAASSVEHGATLATRNARHFEGVPGLEIRGYGIGSR